MNRRLISLLAVASASVGIVVLANDGDDSYRVFVPLRSGYGLEDGSAVRVGGVAKGKVRLRLRAHDKVVAELVLDKSLRAVGKDASVAVVAANFLGQKRVDLTVGDVRRRPAPSGFQLSGARVTVPTDLDQVLGVFDADTRTRAKILINSVGEAVLGRSADVRALLEGLPTGLADASAFVGQLRTDNTTMRALIRRSDAFVSEVARKHDDLGRLVDELAATSTTLEPRRAELASALERAPGTLRTLRALSGELDSAARQLDPAARRIAAAAPPLGATLARLDPVRTAAVPALREATGVAPKLSQLGREAAPVAERATPTVSSLAKLAGALPPLTTALDKSVYNTLAIAENWSRAIQFRDGLSHVFRGEAGLSPDLVLSAVESLVGSTQTRAAAKSAPKAKRPQAQPPTPQAPGAPETHPPADSAAPEQRPDGAARSVGGLGSLLEGVVGGLDSLIGGHRTPQAPSPASPSLLERLLK